SRSPPRERGRPRGAIGGDGGRGLEEERVRGVLHLRDRRRTAREHAAIGADRGEEPSGSREAGDQRLTLERHHVAPADVVERDVLPPPSSKTVSQRTVATTRCRGAVVWRTTASPASCTASRWQPAARRAIPQKAAPNVRRQRERRDLPWRDPQHAAPGQRSGGSAPRLPLHLRPWHPRRSIQRCTPTPPPPTLAYRCKFLHHNGLATLRQRRSSGRRRSHVHAPRGRATRRGVFHACSPAPRRAHYGSWPARSRERRTGETGGDDGPEPRDPAPPNLRDHQPPGRGQDDADGEAAALRRRDPPGRLGQGA